MKKIVIVLLFALLLALLVGIAGAAEVSNETMHGMDDAYGAVDEIETVSNNNYAHVSDGVIYSDDDTVNVFKSKLSKANNDIGKLKNNNAQLTKKLANENKGLKEANNELETLSNILDELRKPPMNTTVTIKSIKSKVGKKVNVTAYVKDQKGNRVTSGRVMFKVNGKTLRDENGNVLYAMVEKGIATITYKVPGSWMKNSSYVEAVYTGNKNYTSSKTKATNVLKIAKGYARISWDMKTITAKSGETVTFRTKVVDVLGERIKSGKVSFKIDGKTIKDKNGKVIYAKLVDGQASVDYTIPSKYNAIKHNLTAVFGGSYYERTEARSILTIKHKRISINTDSITTKNKKVNIRATITDETGALLVTKTKLTIKVNGKTILRNRNSINGKINISYVTTLKPGIYELQIISSENGIYKAGRMTTVLKI